jgi:hypothetical protein
VSPVIEAPPPGLKPTCPIITEVGTESEIAEPPRTAKLSDVKRFTLVVAAYACGEDIIVICIKIMSINTINFIILFKLFINISWGNI